MDQITSLRNRNLLLMMYAMLAAAGTLCLLKIKRKNRVRQYKARPINRKRKTEGQFATLVSDMRNMDEEQYFKYCRMTPNMFDCLLSLVGPLLQKDITKNPLSPAHRLMMTLHYLSQGCSMQQTAWCYRVGKATVHVVVKEVCDVLWNVLSPIELSPPTTQEWTDIAEGFYQRWNVPNCVGSIDGKHVTIQAPANSGSAYFSYKKSHSLVLMAACDAFYRFTLVDIGGCGSNHDSAIFKNSEFGNALLTDGLNVPGSQCLPGSAISINYFMAADAAFPLHKRIMRPYAGKYLGNKKNIFNYRLSRARRVIENTFGILAQRWRILLKPIIANIEMCERIVKATVVLHNFLQKRELDIPLSERRYIPTGYVDHEDDKGNLRRGNWRDGNANSALPSVARVGSNNAGRSVQQVRDILADYFVSDVGSLPWQEEHILTGSLPEH